MNKLKRREGQKFVNLSLLNQGKSIEAKKKKAGDHLQQMSLRGSQKNNRKDQKLKSIKIKRIRDTPTNHQLEILDTRQNLRKRHLLHEHVTQNLTHPRVVERIAQSLEFLTTRNSMANKRNQMISHINHSNKLNSHKDTSSQSKSQCHPMVLMYSHLNLKRQQDSMENLSFHYMVSKIENYTVKNHLTGILIMHTIAIIITRSSSRIQLHTLLKIHLKNMIYHSQKTKK